MILNILKIEKLLKYKELKWKITVGALQVYFNILGHVTSYSTYDIV